MSPDDDRTPPALPLPHASADERERRYAFLVTLDGPQFGRIFPLENGRDLVIGRRDGADVAIHDYGVSRRHALLLVGRDGARLTDLATLNGTWLNGSRIQVATLADGDRIALGAHTSLEYRIVDAQEARYLLRLAEADLHDPVTGLPSERAVVELLHVEIAAARRRGRPVSVLTVEVDDLAELLGHLGHQQGDEALRRVALAIQSALRTEDRAAFCGDGQVLVVPREAEPDGVVRLAARLRHAVRHSELGDGAGARGIGVTIGAATLVPGPNEVPEEAGRRLLEAVGTALDQARRRGRSRFAVLRLAAEGEPVS